MADNDTNPTTTNVSRDVKVTSHENISGHHETFTSDRDVTMSGEFDNRVVSLLNGVLTDRQRAEDVRANHRNFNRLLTLLGAVVIGLLVTYLSTVGIIPRPLQPYTFVITVLLDSSFSMYALWKHY